MQEPGNVYDVIDLIWMPKFRYDIRTDDMLIEIIDVYDEIIVSESLLDILRRCLIMWSGKYISDKKKKDKVIGGLKLSAMEANDLSQAIRSARIEGALLRSQEQGREEGRKEGREEGISITEEKFVPYLLENFTPEEISRDFDVSMGRILEIMDGK